MYLILLSINRAFGQTLQIGPTYKHNKITFDILHIALQLILPFVCRT